MSGLSAIALDDLMSVKRKARTGGLELGLEMRSRSHPHGNVPVSDGASRGVGVQPALCTPTTGLNNPDRRGILRDG